MTQWIIIIIFKYIHDVKWVDNDSESEFQLAEQNIRLLTNL